MFLNGVLRRGVGEEEEEEEKKQECRGEEGKNSLQPPPAPPLYTPGTQANKLVTYRVKNFELRIETHDQKSIRLRHREYVPTNCIMDFVTPPVAPQVKQRVTALDSWLYSAIIKQIRLHWNLVLRTEIVFDPRNTNGFVCSTKNRECFLLSSYTDVGKTGNVCVTL